MKRTVKVLFLASVAMFAFNTVADAQFGGLLKKAKAAVGAKSSEQKAFEQECEAGKLAIPQAKSGAPILFMVEKKGEMPFNEAVASWDPQKLEVTIMTNRWGNTPGTKVKLDPNTGKFTDAEGNAKGSINANGTIESPSFGTLKLEEYKEGVSTQNVKIDKALLGYKINRGSENFSTYKFHGGWNGKLDGMKYYLGSQLKPYTLECKVSDRSLNSLIVAYVYFGLVFNERTVLVGKVGYDPEQKYTVDEIRKQLKMNNSTWEAEIRKVEEQPNAGYKKSDYPQLEGCKVAEIGLTSEIKNDITRVKEGTIFEHTYVAQFVNYYVVYELTNGKNMVCFNTFSYNAREDNQYRRSTVRPSIHEISNWKRK
ncbi:MAG: hypothetical protein J5735_02905 [Prevotella sp.]|nr:hypothetical protein [Prevotella sp.]